jgi:ADP-ribose pyrophosphatase
MTGLSQHQLAALDSYDDLMRRHPELFRGRCLRPIVTDRSARMAYSLEHDVILGVAAETPFQLFVVDLVASTPADGGVHYHIYSRLLSRAQIEGGNGVVVLATVENPTIGALGSIVLVEQERHALGRLALELPRGFGEMGLRGEELALAELREETGFIGHAPRLIGRSYSDSGTTDARVSFFHVGVTGREEAHAENTEAISMVRLMRLGELWEEILSGRIRDAFTIQAIAFFQKAR